MAKPNYRHAKKQKEEARKARQEAKQQRKNTPGGDAGDAAPAGDGPVPAQTVPAASEV